MQLKWKKITKDEMDGRFKCERLITLFFVHFFSDFHCKWHAKNGEETIKTLLWGFQTTSVQQVFSVTRHKMTFSFILSNEGAKSCSGTCVWRWSGINFPSPIYKTENIYLLKDLSCYIFLLIWCFNSYNTPVRLCLYTVIIFDWIFSLWIWISAVPVRLGGEKTC